MAPTKTSPKKRTSRSRRVANSSFGSWNPRPISGLQILQVRAFSKFPWLLHGFSTRPGGVSELADHSATAPEKGQKVLNLGLTRWDSPENVHENRRRFLSSLGANGFALISLEQFHSDVVCVFQAPPSAPCRGDACITNRTGSLLAIQTADCVPILLVDPKQRAIAAIHAGWRGTLARIAVKTIGKMQMEFGTKPADVLAALGPAIGGCCYEVGTEVASQFLSQFPNAAEWFNEPRTGGEPNPLEWLSMAPPGHQPPPKNVFLDLRKANRSQLLEAGLRPGNIFVSGLCTACRPDLLFSYRKQGPLSGRLLSIIALCGNLRDPRETK